MQATEAEQAAARRAGLARALALFPEDVVAAIKSAAAGRQGLGGDLPPTAEPYPKACP